MPVANHLIHETSPYLLQHAYNPVEWFPWGEEALNKARSENKPVLVSIGYAACHWCHVMERESFENEQTAGIMNARFVNIKIDREERPDLDHIYMDAVQALTGSGGWPLHVFLTPEGKPFYGGTYFPPVRMHNRPSWEETLLAISLSFQEKRDEVNTQAEKLTDYLVKSNSFGREDNAAEDTIFSKETPAIIFENCLKNADKVWGGFGRAPKFPQTFTIQYLLRYHHFTKDEAALEQACLSLDKMIYGGIYDQIGGGFSRYSTDAEWHVPHFEKMLYDNALLVIVLSEAYQLTKKELYRTVINQTMEFIRREMRSPENGFYAALDADSEGVEGKYYVWSKEEIESLAGPDAGIFCAYYDVSDAGNWEGNNVLRVKQPLEAFARQQGLPVQELEARLQRTAAILLQARQRRIPPALDHKILLNWNALFNTACSKAYAALGNEEYKKLAIDNMEFLWTAMKEPGHDGFLHTYQLPPEQSVSSRQSLSRDRSFPGPSTSSNRHVPPGQPDQPVPAHRNRPGLPSGVAKYAAFLDDYACLIQALIHLQEITGDPAYLEKAKMLTGYVITHFSDESGKLFYFTHNDQADVIVRKMEIYDGATPSANALMAENLYYLSIIFDKPEWKERALAMTAAIVGLIREYPGSFGMWANFLQKVSQGINELVITGTGPQQLQKEVLELYIPNRVLQVAAAGEFPFPLLRGKPAEGKSRVWLCKNYACQNPVDTVDLLLSLLEN